MHPSGRHDQPIRLIACEMSALERLAYLATCQGHDINTVKITFDPERTAIVSAGDMVWQGTIAEWRCALRAALKEAWRASLKDT
jgi:hypothetical protein